jgi:hypothetical protein
MSNLKHLQNDILNSIHENDINAKIIDNYPDAISYQIQYISKIKDFTLGCFFRFTSTGSRIDYRDYSGRYTFDQTLDHFSFGLINERIPIPSISKRLIQFVQASLILNSLSFDEYLEIFGDPITEDSTKFLSTGCGFDIGFGYILWYKPFQIRLDIGGHISFNSTFYLQDNRNAKLYSSKGKVTPNWNGLMIGITIGYKKL